MVKFKVWMALSSKMSVSKGSFTLSEKNIAKERIERPLCARCC